MEGAFGAGVDYVQLVRLYGDGPGPAGRYSPAECTRIEQNRIEGNPDPAHVSTFYVERQDLTMRMGMRRFTRRLNGFSRKAENHAHSVAIHTMHYNFVRIHKTLRCSPAMAAGVTGKLLGLADMMKVLEDWEAAHN